MMKSGSLLIFTISISVFTAAMIYFIKEDRVGIRSLINISGALIKFLFVIIILVKVFHNIEYSIDFHLCDSINISFKADPLAMLFIILSSFLWIITTLYAIGYLEDSKYRSRFFTFYSLCITATAGISFAGDLFTFYIFYELLTLSTYPLVVHDGTEKSIRAGKIYLIYAILGSLSILIGMAMIYNIAGGFEFRLNGILKDDFNNYRVYYISYLFFLIGFGVKAAFFPLHYWLPEAMVAPAPVSALLHAVAVVKAGVFGILRVTYDIYGLDMILKLGVDDILFYISSFTIIYGSVKALSEHNIKKRLAYSTVSQLSYIPFGLSLGTVSGEIGGVVHIIHQGIMKITLFMCAGIFYKLVKVKFVNELDGLGRRMPVTMTAFSIAALGMIGIPPTTGFITKLYLGIGSYEASSIFGIIVLILSSILNALYFLPLIYRGWFLKREINFNSISVNKIYINLMIFSVVITSTLIVIFGVFASSTFSSLKWAEMIVKINYGFVGK